MHLLTPTPLKHFATLKGGVEVVVGGGGAKTTPLCERAGTQEPKELAYNNGGLHSTSCPRLRWL